MISLSAVKCGRIQVDGQLVPVSFIVKPSQKISHFLHRHEPPVMTWDVKILETEPDVVTICKPASVPVHPCGQYRKNTVVGILQAEHGLAPLFRIQNLRHKTSGSFFFFFESSVNVIEGGMVHKQYIARVIGEFPEEEQVVDANINHNAREGRSSAEVGDSCGDAPTKGKTACTKFTRISTNGTQSIVMCESVTGCTHKICVHLQHAGHPIANDMLYLSKHVSDRSAEGIGADRAAANPDHSPASGVGENKSTSHEDSSEDFSIDPMCSNCPNLAPKGYSVPGWVYECPHPDWHHLASYSNKSVFLY
ncbi:putative tRNA pseudouridine(32) synthase [Rosa chinensis]|uniref:Putative tRNA pseudouridine(32) synthase n=1 Tax=Rosa chinensis TaxID=74649 RepID=A0A2P6P4R2_ROSCH|nr:putative tRNA pseudouridine(32) synthase [Rosa chinensis]